MARRIFINYRIDDTRPTASHLAADLAREFGDEAVFLDHRSVEPAEKWPERLRDEVAVADIVLVLIGEGWLTASDEHGRRRLDLQDDWVRQEIAAALGGDGKVLPLLVNDTPPIAAAAIENLPDIVALADLQARPLRDVEWDIDTGRLVDWIVGEGFEQWVTPADAPTPADSHEHTVEVDRKDSALADNPYRSLSAFQEEDAAVFFGREALIQETLLSFSELLDRSVERSRFLAIVGPSGCGKSSFARAGLAARLNRESVPGRPGARVLTLVPGQQPAQSLGRAFEHLGTKDDALVSACRAFADELAVCEPERAYALLDPVLRARPGDAPSHLIVLVDQFEEVYSQARDASDAEAFLQERDNFVAALVDAADDSHGALSVLLTLRSDFLGETQRHTRLNALIARQHCLVPAMSAEELHEAIAQPAAGAGHALPETVVAQLIEQTVRRDGVLPLLQFVLTRLWDAMRVGMSAEQTLAQLGGVGGALAREAERLYQHLGEVEQQIARRAFLAMVNLAEGAQDTRRRVKLERLVASHEAPEQVEAVLRAFARHDRRLVTLSGEKGARIVAEVTHEALFSNWLRLKGWLEDAAQKPEVFICHSSVDKAIVGPIVRGLIMAGFTVFVDRPEAMGLEGQDHVRGLSSGPFREGLAKAIEDCDCVLALWSTNAVDPANTVMHEEATRGMRAGKFVQATLEPLAELQQHLPLGFQAWQVYDVSRFVVGAADVEAVEIPILVREIRDIVGRHAVTKAYPPPAPQNSRVVNLAVVEDKLRTVPKPPPPLPESSLHELERLKKLFVDSLRRVASRLENTNFYMEQDIRENVLEILSTFDRPIERLDPVLGPSYGELISVLAETYGEPEVKREIAEHVVPSLKIAVHSYRSFATKWGGWTAQIDDPARDFVTPENADRTREAADIVTQFTASSTIVHESVPTVFRALRQLIGKGLNFSQLNEYRYLNAVGEGLRVCWNEGEKFLNRNWHHIQHAVETGETIDIGPFNRFIVEMEEPILALASHNADLFGWLHIRVGYLRRLRRGELFE